MAGLAGLATGALPLLAAAQSFPSKPITIVVPYPPGGTTDVLARVLQEPLQRLLGQVVIVDNRPGASAMLGTKLVARAPADGYTLLFPNNGLVISPHISKDAGYAPLTDFAPVSLVSLQPMVLVINPAVPARNVRELLDYAKANPGKINYASAGPASFGHLSTLLLARDAGVKMEHIPYKGQAPTTQAVLTGEVQMLMTTTSSQMNGFHQGRPAAAAGRQLRAAFAAGAGRRADQPDRARLQRGSLVRGCSLLPARRAMWWRG